jgi:hypothetical protein
MACVKRIKYSSALLILEGKFEGKKARRRPVRMWTDNIDPIDKQTDV